MERYSERVSWLDFSANIFFLQGFSCLFSFFFLMLQSALVKWSKVKTGLNCAASLFEFHPFSK